MRRAERSHGEAQQAIRPPGLEPCGSFGCRFGGSIQVEGGRWFCRFHSGKPDFQAKVVTESLNEHGSLASEVLKGFNRIATPRLFGDAQFQTWMLDHAAALIPMGYQVQVERADMAAGKSWIAEYRAFVMDMDKTLRGLVNTAIKEMPE